ncbi:uracil-DNA glycosylase family protein [Moraxella nasibovis]|uniref:uracil-DNA glycosylase family protein n=1 Tax=Moraxella nasibovis TaxID=2904120 RepID=UPI00240F0FF8|nr:uracil-DNA glycosylase family protein [Moraxella nasibovis]WFF39489.1 uracil-DNA glycosylase family protein [Moraxella nasibovis]
MNNPETHPLAPFTPPDAKVLILGSFPPPKSRWKMDFYYPNFNNDMWRILGLVFYKDKHHFIDIVNKTFKEQLIKEFLNEQGIAISDTAYQIKRLANNASDKFLEVVTEQDIKALLDKLPNCHTLITTGEKASQILCQRYDAPAPKVGESVKMMIGDRKVQLYRLPSSSRAYPLATEKKAEYYQAVFERIFDVD